MQQTESKKEILARRKEIERELIDLLKETESDFSLRDVKDVIFHEEDTDDMMKVVAMFDRGGDASELSNVLELVSDAWNYFPHKVLGGISPAEKILEYQNKQNKINKIKNNMPPKYDLDKIKFATDGPTFEKAVAIYESGGVKNFEYNGVSGFLARVKGSGGNFYEVFVSARRYDEGGCNCYLGQNNTLCKHMVVVAIYAVKEGKLLTDKEKQQVSQVTCSGRLGEVNKKGLLAIKKEITDAMKYIKSYNGPSRIWFQYQNSLSEGCNRLSKIISELPVSEQTAKLLVNVLLRLDDKLCRGGVDDSDGTVGGFIEETVQVLEEYVKLDPNCVKAFEGLKGKETCFGWEEPLLALLEE